MDTQALYPLSKLMRGVIVAAPPPEAGLLEGGRSPLDIALVSSSPQSINKLIAAAEDV